MDDIKNSKAAKTAKLSVASNCFLVVLKFIAGIFSGSVAIISEAAHSLIDLIAALIAFFAIKESSKPADSAHPYGHGKFENISGAIEALLIFAAAAVIIYEAVKKLINPQPINMPAAAIAVMLFCAFINLLVSKKLFAVAKETNSIALEADAWHLTTDVYTSLGVAIALTAVFVLNLFTKNPNVCRIDALAALTVACMIIKAACNLTLKAAKDLVDVSLPKEEVAGLENIIRNFSQIEGYHDLRTRNAGGKIFAEFHILVNPQMSVLESHGITREIAKEIKQKFEGASITIHVEPCDDVCTEKCRRGCLLKNKALNGACKVKG
jgi:cation diffusion facilitator family transporter